MAWEAAGGERGGSDSAYQCRGEETRGETPDSSHL